MSGFRDLCLSPMGHVETLAVARRARAGDRAARDRLILSNVPLVIRIARASAGKGLECDDLIAHGVVGLVRATDRFDPDLGYRFSTLASYWIKQAIRRAIQRAAHVVHVPIHLQESGRRLDAGNATDQDRHYEPMVRLSRRIRRARRDRLDGLVGMDVDPSAEAADREQLARIVRSFGLLTPVQRDVVRSRLGLDGPPEFLRDIAARHGKCTSWARWTYERAIEILRAELDEVE